jgi:hypothetical protein
MPCSVDSTKKGSIEQKEHVSGEIRFFRKESDSAFEISLSVCFGEQPKQEMKMIVTNIFGIVRSTIIATNLVRLHIKRAGTPR